MNLNYEIYTESIRNTKPDNMRNGDFTMFSFLEDEQILYLALSDGVGSTDGYWLAAKTICENTLKYFTEYDFSDKSIESRMIYSIEKANQDILDAAEERGSTMLATLCLVIWQLNENKIYYTSLGDSRIYLLKNKILQQITDDQKHVEVLIKNNKPQIIDGVVATRTMLSNAVGMSQLVINVQTREFLQGESLFICSDGLYECTDMESTIPKLLESSNLRDDFIAFMKEVAANNFDDATALLMRRNDFPSEIIDDLPQHLFMLNVIKDLELSFSQNNKKDVLDIIKSIFNSKNKLDRTDYVKIIDLWGKSDLLKQGDKEINTQLLNLRKKF